jgi:Na+-transporting methylmalonyl-CoA/oxaloacetate decarboxylase gamma subunit
MAMDLAFELMGLGLIGVFSALFILFFSVIIMTKIFPHRKKED